MDEAAQPQPIPKRYWWLKRLSAGAACLLGALILLRLWWGYEANRRLAAEIKRWQAAGQPVFAAEFDAIADAVPDEDNAALLYEEAIGLIVATSTAGVNFREFIDTPETVKGKEADARELTRLNQPALQRVRQARHRTAVAWRFRLDDPSVTTPMPNLSGHRMLARLLHFAARQQFAAGNHAEALATSADFLAFNDALDANPVLAGLLTAWACHNLNFKFIEESAPTLRIREGDDAPSAETGAATRDQVKRLIDALLREEGRREAVVHAFYGDRASKIRLLDPYIGRAGGWDQLAARHSPDLRPRFPPAPPPHYALGAGGHGGASAGCNETRSSTRGEGLVGP